MHHQRAIWAFLLSAAALACWGPAEAQRYPSKPVRIFIGNPPGVGNDILARGLAQYLAPRMGQPLIVENRIGADGVVANDACAKAPPDGYTLCIGAQGNFVVVGLLNSKLPYDLTRDFIPVVNNGFFDSGLLVHSSLPVRSLQQLIEASKAKADAIPWGIFSYGGSQYFYEQYLKRNRGASFLVVPYKGANIMFQALTIGEVQASVYTMEFAEPFIKAGKLRVLAVTSPERYPAYPEVPTFAELGIQLPLRTWYGTFAPTGTPPDVVSWWNSEYARAATDVQFRAKYLDPQGLKFSPNTPAEFAAYVSKNRQEMAELIKYLDLKVE